METVLGVFNEDSIAHPWIPHVFVVPGLMTSFWRKQLTKDADVLFEVQVGDHLLGRSQHEPLIVALVLPIVHVTSYRGPWLARETPEVESLVRELYLGFKFAKNPRHAGLPLVDGALCGLWKDAEGRSGNLLREFLVWAGGFPPVRECSVRGLLQRIPERSLPTPAVGGSRGRKRDAPGRCGRATSSKREKRGPLDEGPL